MVPFAEAAFAALMSWNALAGHAVLPAVPRDTSIVLAADTIVDPAATVASPTKPALEPTPSPALAFRQPVALTLGVGSGELVTGLGLLDGSPQDTVRKPRAKAYEYSDNYYWRLKWHKRLSWAMIPLFAASYFSGNELLQAADEGREAKSWAKNLHGPAATGSAMLFTANTITGGLNLWEGPERSQRAHAAHRTQRAVHRGQRGLRVRRHAARR